MNPTRTASIMLITLLAAAGCSAGETRSAAHPAAGAAAADPAAARSATTSTPGDDTTPNGETDQTAPTAPPVTVPPVVTIPPITLPPVTVPPVVTIPPITLPPVTVPPVVTIPPVTVPPVTVPPVVTIPPITLPPVTVPPVIGTVPLVPITIPPVFGGFPAPDCGVFGDIPADASNVETMSIDVDDDGTDDTVTTYFAAIGDSAGWRLRTEIAGGPVDDVAIEGVGPGIAKILGAVHADRAVVDPATWRPELLVQAGANSSGPNLTVFGVHDDGCLFRFDDEGGDAIVLPIHGSIGTMSGLRCDAISGDQFLVRLEAEHSGGSTYAATQTVLERDGDALVPAAVIASNIDADTNGAWLSQFGELDCGSISL